MVKVGELYYDGYIYKAIDNCVERQKRKYDNLLIVVGKVGTGKSTLAIQLCHLYSHMTGLKFDHKNIVFSGEEFFRAGQKANQIILYDEAIEGLMSSNWANKMSKYTVQLLNMNRKFRNFYVLCIPSITKLNYDIVQRAHIVFRTYTKGFNRGFGGMYPDKGNCASNFYYGEKKRRPFPMKPLRTFKFLDHSEKIIDVKAYEKAKTRAIQTLMDKDETSNATLYQKKYYRMLNSTELTTKQLATILDVHRTNVDRDKRLAKIWASTSNDPSAASNNTHKEVVKNV